MKRLRLVLWQTCNRRCEGCSNLQIDWRAVPRALDFERYDEVILTGGEPMLYPDTVLEVVRHIRFDNPGCRIYMYTAKPTPVDDVLRVLEQIDGITVTLHCQADARAFDNLYRAESWSESGKSLRLVLFNGVKLLQHAGPSWQVKRPQWSSQCKVPEEELRVL